MGYSVWIDGEWDIPADNVGPAFIAVIRHLMKRDKLAKPSDDPEGWVSYHYDIEDVRSASLFGDFLATTLDEYGFGAGPDDDGNVSIWSPDTEQRIEDEYQWVFEVTAPFADPGSCIQFKGEDDAQWQWRIKNGKFLEEPAETVYGDDVRAPDVLQLVIDELYPGGTSVVKNSMPAYDWEQLVNRIETIVRENGFGPDAGKSELERMAEV